MFSSCTRYVVTPGGEGGCGAWHEKKFQGNKAPKQRAKGMPVIWQYNALLNAGYFFAEETPDVIKN